VDHRLWFPFQASPADEATAKPFNRALNLQVGQVRQDGRPLEVQDIRLMPTIKSRQAVRLKARTGPSGSVELRSNIASP
jgi:hypothetical protein